MSQEPDLRQIPSASPADKADSACTTRLGCEPQQLSLLHGSRWVLVSFGQAVYSSLAGNPSPYLTQGSPPPLEILHRAFVPLSLCSRAKRPEIASSPGPRIDLASVQPIPTGL
jgi:hypothetical protein